MNTSLKEYLADTYLDWLNNYLTVGRFAEVHGMEVGDAFVLIRLGRRMQEERATGEFPDTPQPAIPPGYKLVPVEPTEEMRSAGTVWYTAKSTWHAMLNAAPEAPQPAKPTEPQGVQDERPAFEAWAKTQGNPENGWWFRKLPDGGYSAGRPPDNTGCLPVDYTAEQLDAWRAEDEYIPLDGRDMLALAVVLVLMLVSVGLIFWRVFV